jgi:succinate dehydrogenase / fumarate reductase cytochrome b subunit
MNKDRPISPHLSIYKPQINSFISIMHRFTGIGLFFVSIILPWTCVLYIFGCQECMNQFGLLLIDCKITKIFFFLLSFCFVYHSLNGIRHLFYDIGYGFSIKQTNLTGWLVLVLSFIITGTIWNFCL